MSKEYKNEEYSKNIEKLKQILDTLPPFTIDFFYDLVGSQEMSPRTVVGYARDLELFFYFLKRNNPEIKDISKEVLEQLKPLDINEYLFFLTSYQRNGKNYKNDVAGKRRKLSALKTFWKWCINYQVLKNNPTLLSSGPRVKKKEIVKVETHEIQAVYDNIIHGHTLTEHSKKLSQKTKLRDLAIISLLLGTGIRVSECAGLNLEDVNFHDNSIILIRKGGKEQKVYFNSSVAYNLTNYIERERNTTDTALFISKNKTRLSVRSIEKLVLKYVNPVASGHITPHKLRATFATELYNQSHDIYLTQISLGHEQTQTTLHYTEMNEERRKDVVKYTQNL